jgi:uncharacterized protein
MNPAEIFAKHGFPYPSGLIMAFIGGSTQHGASADDGLTLSEAKAIADRDDPNADFNFTITKSDTDWYGLFIPPKEKTLGIDSYENFVFPGDVSHRSRGTRNTDELDIALHSLQKWAGMACKGNPTTLSFLFAKPEALEGGYSQSRWWSYVTDNAFRFIAKSHYKPFLYYAQDQMERLLGLRGQKNINRDHLVDQFGYDTKYAMHIIRLMSEAKELMELGKITYPRPEVELLKDIRRGKYKLTEINQMGDQLNSEVLAAAERTALPEKVDRAKISELIANIHLDFYRS